ncbi:hypothetical protein NHQ30_003234 [Ciborinia camelliae]|nr:hypothetical protein NHQ30_003234 [Ciborinia camelliae]
MNDLLSKLQLWKLPKDSPFYYEGAVTWASIEARGATLKNKEFREETRDRVVVTGGRFWESLNDG